MVSVILPTMVPLHGILCHSCSDINRNLIASSGLWKLICFLWINVTTVFSMLVCYYVLLFVFFGLCFVRFVGHVGACSIKCIWDVLPDALCLAYYDCPLCVCTVSVTYWYNFYENCKALRAFSRLSAISSFHYYLLLLLYHGQWYQTLQISRGVPKPTTCPNPLPKEGHWQL